MAFHPFNWFRKHQKVIFAALTILCMFVFIGQFGAGDAVSRILDWVGASRATGDVVATMYNKKVYEGDLARLERHRKAANAVLRVMLVMPVPGTKQSAHDAVCQALLKELSSPSATSPLLGLDKIVQAAQMRTGERILDAFRGMPQQNHERMASFLRMQIQEDLSNVERKAALEAVTKDPDALNKLQRLARILGYQIWFLDSLFEPSGRTNQAPLIFGGGVKPEDLLDFRLWLHEADRLKINLTEEDVKKEVVADAAGAELFDANHTFTSDPLVVGFVRQNRELQIQSTAELLEAVRNEYRVAMAQGILLGNEPGLRAYRTRMGTASSPALATPDEFLNFVREQRTNLRVQFLPISAASYLPQVTEKPSASELKSRFDRFKDQEPSLISREPGFKEPRRIVVDVLAGSPQDPYYRDLARQSVKDLLTLSQPRNRLATALAAVTNPSYGRLVTVFDPLRHEYEEDQSKNHVGWFDDPREIGLTRDKRMGGFHYTSALKPAGLASLFGSLSGGSGLNAASSLALNAGVVEARTSLHFNLTMLLGLADPLHVLGAFSQLAVALPPPTPESLMLPQIVANFEERLAEGELNSNLSKVVQEVMKFRGKRGSEARKTANEEIAKLAKKYHLRQSGMPGPLTFDGLTTALKKKEKLGLDGVREAILSSFQGRTQRLEAVSATLFATFGSFEPRQQFAPEPSKEVFVWWRSEDLEPRARKFSEVEDQVVLAWRMERARQLARQKAEQLEDEINKGKLDVAAAQKVLATQKQGTLFELDNVAQLVPPREVLAARATEYRAYQVPEEKMDHLEFPPLDLAKQLMVLKRPGQATVITDMPAKTFYVAVLLERSVPTIEDFKAIYAKTPTSDTLYERFLAQRRQEYRKTVLEQLRREAVGRDDKKLDRDGRFKLSDAITKRESAARVEDE